MLVLTLYLNGSTLDFIGTPALTSRNFKEADFIRVADFIDTGIKIALEARTRTGNFQFTDF